MRTYELMLLIRPNPDAAVATQVTEWVAGLIENNGGQVIATDVWGRRKLAYPIDNQREGFYVLLKLALAPAAINGIEFEFKLNENLLRYLFVKNATIDLSESQPVASEQAAPEESNAEEVEISTAEDASEEKDAPEPPAESAAIAPEEITE